jgi:hypothetical protein
MDPNENRGWIFVFLIRNLRAVGQVMSTSIMRMIAAPPNPNIVASSPFPDRV